MSRSRARLLALFTVLALMAAACGGAEEPTAEPTDAEPAPADTEPGTDAPTEPADEATADAGAAAGNGVLEIGYVLPETGQLAFFGPPTINAARLAVEDINAAGGVLGTDVTIDGGDSGDGDGTIANQTVDRLLSQGVDAIIGAAASGITLTIIDKITGGGVVQCSPSNTSPTFTTYDDNGFYFRTAPTDALQGPVLAETMVGDGHTAVAIMARADDYGQGLADATEAALQEAGAEVVAKIVYDPMAQNFDADVAQIAESGPDAIALIGFDESARILQAMIEQGIGPADVGLYGTDGNRSGELPGNVDPSNPAVLEGMKGTAPSSETNEEFVGRLLEFAPDLEETLFAAESYDCVVMIALAAVAAGSDDPTSIRDNMVAISKDGTACSSFAECVELLDAGEDINYEGISGPQDFVDAGEPGCGVYEIWEFNADGEIDAADEVEFCL